MRSIFFVALVMGLWYGGDGIYVNLVSGKLTTFSMDTVEKYGVANSRYIRVTDGYYGNNLVYQYDQDTKRVDYVIIPVLTESQLLALENEQEVIARVAVKIDVNFRESDVSSWFDELEMNADVTGVVQVGFDNISSEQARILEEGGLKLNDSLILISEGEEPRAFWLNLLMFLPGFLVIVFFIFILFSKTEEETNTTA